MTFPVKYLNTTCHMLLTSLWKKRKKARSPFKIYPSLIPSLFPGLKWTFYFAFYFCVSISMCLFYRFLHQDAFPAVSGMPGNEDRVLQETLSRMTDGWSKGGSVNKIITWNMDQRLERWRTDACPAGLVRELLVVDSRRASFYGSGRNALG